MQNQIYFHIVLGIKSEQVQREKLQTIQIFDEFPLNFIDFHRKSGDNRLSQFTSIE